MYFSVKRNMLMNEEIKYQISKINQKIKELNALYHMAALKAEIPDGEIAISHTRLRYGVFPTR